MTWQRKVFCALTILVLFVLVGLLGCSIAKLETVGASQMSSKNTRDATCPTVLVQREDLLERLIEAEERIYSLEIQQSLCEAGERERAALLHGFEEIGR